MADDTQTIKCIILTMHKENVILPNANVAEIVAVKDIHLAENKPGWYLGEMQWRGRDVPLLSYEAAAGDEIAGVNLNTQAIVLHSVGQHDGVEVPFLALVMSGVPHVTRFTRRQIVTDEDELEVHPMIAQKVRINGARVGILDIDAMVAMAADSMAEAS